MSIFSNPASAATEAAQKYIEATLALVGDRDPFDILGSTAGFCARLTDSLGEAQLRAPEAPDKWSAANLLQHFADSEIVWAYRLRMILAEDRPTLPGYDQDHWVDVMDYDSIPVTQSIRIFRLLREANLRLLANATDEQLNRTGVHSERGDETLAHMIRLGAGHDLVHRNQLERIVRAVRAER